MTEIDYNLLGKILAREATEEEKETFNMWLHQSESNKDIFEKYRYFFDQSTINEIYAQDEKIKSINPKTSNISFIKYAAVAASLLLFAFVSFLFVNKFENTSENQIVATNNLILKSNPQGQKSKIMLPDGSTVWLNSDSRIEYDENFSDSIRKVSLVGEAFFEVAKDSQRPFKVITDQLESTVLGTSFNISAFPEDESVSVSLLTGKLAVSIGEVQEVMLPGNQVIYDKVDSHVHKQDIDVQKIAAWKDGILVFEKENINSVVASLERWYGVRIDIIGELSDDWRFTGYFDNEYLKNVLEVLCYGKNITYEINGKNVKIINQ